MSIAIIGGRGRGKHGNDASGHGADESFKHEKDDDGGASMMDSFGRKTDSAAEGGVKGDDIEEGDGRPAKESMSLRDRIWLFFDDPSYSAAGYYLSITILLLITLSCTCFVIETIPSMCCGRYDLVWSTIENLCVSAFTAEYLARLLVCPVWSNPNRGSIFNWVMDEDVAANPKSWTFLDRVMLELTARLRFFFKILNLVDCAAILPFYISMAMPDGQGSGGTQFLRVIRLARVFRLFKLSKYSEGMHLLSNTMIRSWRALGMLFFFMVISVIVFSSVMYFVERGQYFFCSQSSFEAGLCDTPVNRTEGMGLDECNQWANDESNVVQDKNLRCCFGEAWYAYPPTDVNGDQCADKSKYESIPATFWWCVVTMTTVGYGDVTPLTTWGKVVAMVTMIGGILILALPITVIGSNFNIEYENSENKKKQKQDLADEDGKVEVVKAMTESADIKRSGGLPMTTSTTTLRNSLDQQVAFRPPSSPP